MTKNFPCGTNYCDILKMGYLPTGYKNMDSYGKMCPKDTVSVDGKIPSNPAEENSLIITRKSCETQTPAKKLIQYNIPNNSINNTMNNSINNTMNNSTIMQEYNQSIYRDQPKNFWLGTAPSCDPDPKQCSRTPGFRFKGVTSDCGDGKCCNSGKKMLCEYDQLAFERDKVLTKANQYAETKWFGTAPFCGYTRCDVLKEGFIPIYSDGCGDGACCSSGTKWLGRKPISENDVVTMNVGAKECIDKYGEKTTWDVVEEGLTKGLGFTKQIVDIGGSVGKTGVIKSLIEGVI